MLHRRLVVLMMEMSLAAASAQAQQVATVVVDAASTPLPGPRLVAFNELPPVELRGSTSGASFELQASLRDREACVRSMSVATPRGHVLALDSGKASWLPAVGVGLWGRGSRSAPVLLPPQQGPQPPLAPPASSRSNSQGASLGVGIALGAALFERLRERCESSVQARFALPDGVDPSSLAVQVQTSPRDQPAAVASFSFGLRAVDTGAFEGTPPAAP